MIRKSTVSYLAASTSNTREFTAILFNHLFHIIKDVVSHASELAHHCGRKRVQAHDVAQAMSRLCLMCASYHIGSDGIPVCKVLSTSKKVGGSYPNNCDDNISQCTTGFATCLTLTGGGKPTRRKKNHGYHVQDVSFDRGLSRRLRQITHRGGDSLNKSKHAIVVKKSVCRFGKNNYDVSWTPNSLQLLEKGFQFHTKKVLHDTRIDIHFKRSPRVALERVSIQILRRVLARAPARSPARARGVSVVGTALKNLNAGELEYNEA